MQCEDQTDNSQELPNSEDDGQPSDSSDNSVEEGDSLEHLERAAFADHNYNKESSGGASPMPLSGEFNDLWTDTRLDAMFEDQYRRDDEQGLRKAQVPATERDIEAWPTCAFEATGGHPSRVALLIAIGALAGESALQIQAASSALHDRFMARAPDISPSEAPFVLDISPRDRLFEEFRVVRVTDDASPGERLVFQSPHQGSSVLQVGLCHLSVEIGKDVGAWLIELGQSPNRRLRIAAGRAYGASGALDSDLLRDPVIDAWRRAPSERPLDALDAAFREVGEKGGRVAVDSAIDLMRRRCDFDDLYALAALARGEYGRERPDRAMELLARLLQFGRMDSFSQALRGYMAWLFMGQKNPAHSGQVFRALDAFAPGSDLEKVQKAWLVMALLSRIRRGRAQDLAAFAANMADRKSVEAFGRLLNYVFFFPDGKVKGPGIRGEARQLTKSILRAGMRGSDSSIRNISMPLFKAAIEQGQSDQSALLSEMIALWRETAPARPAGATQDDKPQAVPEAGDHHAG